MKFRSYNKEIKNIITQVIDVLNNVIIFRGSDEEKTIKAIPVPCFYGNATRISKSQSNPAGQIVLPISTLELSSIERLTDIVHSTNRSVLFDGVVSPKLRNLFNNVGVPIKLDFKLTSMANSFEDINQIIGHLYTMFKPDLYIIVPHPWKQFNLKWQVVCNGDISYGETNEESDNQSPTRITAETDIYCIGWLFPGLNGRLTEINPCDKCPNKPFDDTKDVCRLCPDNPNDPDNPFHQFSPSDTKLIKIIESDWYDVPNPVEFSSFNDAINNGFVEIFDHITLAKENSKPR